MSTYSPGHLLSFSEAPLFLSTFISSRCRCFKHIFFFILLILISFLSSVHLSTGLSRVCVPCCLSLVISVSSPHWLFLRLLKPMLQCDWWIKVALDHAGSKHVYKKHMVHETNGLGGQEHETARALCSFMLLGFFLSF